MRPLSIVEKGGVKVIKVRDNAALNEGHAAGLRQGIYGALASTPVPRVAIDLSSVDYISSTGIALLIGTKRRIDAAQGQLVLFSLHPDILDLFGIMRLVALFDIAKNEADALTLFPTLPTS